MTVASPDFNPDFATPSGWATEYRRSLLQVIPCYRPDEAPKGSSWKRPKLAEWGEFQAELVSDEVFARWYDQHSGAHHARFNMGIITGTCSDRTMVVDLDTHKDPRSQQWWDGLIALHENRQDLFTVEQQTGGGGRQKLFRYPVGWHAPTNKTGIGVDIRGQGGFAVLPPSMHDTGKTYEWLPGRAPWETPILDAPQWLLDAVEALVEAYGGDKGGHKENAPQANAKLDAWGNIIDGRESYMAKVVWGSICDFKRENPIGRPSEAESVARAEAAYEAYERHVRSALGGDNREALERESKGRGATAFLRKWRAAMRHWDDRVAEHALLPNPNAKVDLVAKFAISSEKAQEQAKADPKLQYPYMSTRQIKTTPDPVWLIDGTVPEKVVGFIFGPPASLKTFIALDMALSMATGQPSWWGRPLNKPGAVVYISSEGIGGLKFRLAAWERHRRTNTDDRPFFLIRESINFMRGEDIGKLLATVQAIKDEARCEIVAIFVDTVSRVLPGAEENQQKDMSIFVGACDQLRQQFNATVIGIHHSNKQGGMRGSTVIPAAGDFVLEVAREPGEMTGTITATKIKDAVDGWQIRFKVTEINLGTIVPRTSTLVVDFDPNPPIEGAGLPSKDVLRRVIVAMNEAWAGDRPWSDSPQSRGRYAPRRMAAEFSIPIKQGEYLIEEWLNSKAIQLCVHNAHKKTTGLKELNGIG